MGNIVSINVVGKRANFYGVRFYGSLTSFMFIEKGSLISMKSQADSWDYEVNSRLVQYLLAE